MPKLPLGPSMVWVTDGDLCSRQLLSGTQPYLAWFFTCWMGPLDTFNAFTACLEPVFLWPIKAQWYTAGCMARPAQAVSVPWVLFAFGVDGSGNVTMCLLCVSRCSMSTEDGAKLYDVCPHVSDSVRCWLFWVLLINFALETFCAGGREKAKFIGIY